MALQSVLRCRSGKLRRGVVTGAAADGSGATPPLGAAAGAPGPPVDPGVPNAALLPPPPPAARVRLPGGGVLNRLTGQGDLLTLTVDDGVNTDVVRLNSQFARDTGVRLTYFVNGIYKSWTENVALLRPLAESGQIQLANHTWSHPNLTTVLKSQCGAGDHVQS